MEFVILLIVIASLVFFFKPSGFDEEKEFTNRSYYDYEYDLKYLNRFKNRFTEEKKEIFEKPESIKKQRRAKTEGFVIKKLNKEKQIAQIESPSGNFYTTSLKACTCPNFEDEREPCKHMYFLADKLGIFSLEKGKLCEL